MSSDQQAVLASVKVRNLKANHSRSWSRPLELFAVLASVKVRNLKANHSISHIQATEELLY